MCVQMDLSSTRTRGCVCVFPGESGSNMDSRLTVDAQAGRLRAHASVEKPQVCALRAPARAQVCARPSRAGGYRVPPPGGALGGGLPGRPPQPRPAGISARSLGPALPEGRRAPRQVSRRARAEPGPCSSPPPPRGGPGAWGRRTPARIRGPREPGTEGGDRAAAVAGRDACGSGWKGGARAHATRTPRPVTQV